MSQQLINRSPDLKKLRDEGYDIEIKSGHLLVRVPYVNSAREVKLGTLVSELTLAGDTTTKPNTHAAYFEGEYPCTKDGVEIGNIRHSTQKKQLAPDIEIHHMFSSKPANGYSDYYEKMTTYISIISNHAHSLDPNVKAKTFPVIEPDEEESVFNYIDTASTRAGINMVSSKLELNKDRAEQQ